MAPDISRSHSGGTRTRIRPPMDRSGARIVGGVTDIIWSPTRRVRRASQRHALHARPRDRDAEELVARSVADVAWFWDAVVHDLDIEFLRAVRTGPRRLARGGMGDVVRRRPGEPRAPMRRPLGGVDAGGAGGRVGGRGRRGPDVELRGSPSRDDRLARALRRWASRRARPSGSSCRCCPRPWPR